MKCPKCGVINSENSKNCSECGQALQLVQNKQEAEIQQTEINQSVTRGEKNRQKYWMFIDSVVIFICVALLAGKLISQIPEKEITTISLTQQNNNEDSQASIQQSVGKSGVQEIENEKKDSQQSGEGSAAALTSTTTTDAADTYILPDSAIRLISESELNEFTAWELRIARNEVYARHGRKFNDTDLQNYFDSQRWYSGTIAPEDFNDTTMLNDIEKKNLDTIMSVEAKLASSNSESNKSN